MPLTYHPNIRKLFMGRAVLAAFSSPMAISVYTNSQPTALHVTNNWTSYTRATSLDFLVHYQGGTWTQPNSDILLQLFTIPPGVIPTRSGTATWAILWNTNVTGAAVDGATLPTPNFLVVPVSDSIGQGVIRFADPILSTAAVATILDGSMGAYLTA